MAKVGEIVADTLFEPVTLRGRAIDWDQNDRGVHQGAQHSCKSDAVYMAATDQTPKSINTCPAGAIHTWFKNNGRVTNTAENAWRYVSIES